jgi:hypothetical protein
VRWKSAVEGRKKSHTRFITVWPKIVDCLERNWIILRNN